MPDPIEFFFDFSSPYGYLGSTQIDALADRHHRQAHWKPYLVGTAMKITGHQPLASTPMIREYAYNDIYRFARLLDVPFALPDPFPIMTAGAARGFYWILDQDAATAKHFAQSVYRAYFVDNVDVSQSNVLIRLANEAGVDGEQMLRTTKSTGFKDRFRQENEAALDKGVFGSPFFIVDGEAFWGVDRLDQLDRWLKTGGW